MFFAAAAFLSVRTASPARAASLIEEPRVRAFIRRMHVDHQFVPAELEAFFARLSINPKVEKLLGSPAAPAKKTYWREYRKRRLTAKNVAAGVRFARRHAAVLRRAEEEFGVPAEVIVAIIGVETKYGNYLGNFSAAEALATLAFSHPTRGDEFLAELADLLIYARDVRIDPLTIFGSYAGAFGIPQFLPSSVLIYAVDFDGDGRADLFNFADAIGSVGNFLRQHGWRRGAGISYPARASSAAADAAVAVGAKNDYKAVFSRQQFADMGVLFDAPAGDGPYLFVDLENRYDTEYRIGTDNFYALTRYNKSFKYAAAVTDLAAAVAAAGA